MTMPNFTLAEDVVMVTGAAGAIGSGISKALAKAGAVVGCVDTTGEALAPIVDVIGQDGGRAVALVADVCDERQLSTAVAELEKEFGPLRGALNCAGIHNTAPAREMPREQWQRMVDVNLTGVFVSCQVEGRAMIENGGGSIVNISSISAHIANRGLQQAHYNAVKSGVSHLTRSLAVEWAAKGIRVNAISPGYMSTPMAKTPEVKDFVQALIEDIPMRRMGEVDELAGPSIFLLSDASTYCTGIDLVADGGAILW